ncbi:MAG: hypothetical protein RIC84_08785 [Aggregatilineales bacterium]
MPNFGNFMNKAWIGTAFDADPTWLITRDSVSLVLLRGATNLSAQTVRIVPQPSGGREQQTPKAGNQGVSSKVIVIGDGDLNVQAGDRFAYEGRKYRVVSVDASMPNKTEAWADGVE